jgi:hypothetical protein
MNKAKKKIAAVAGCFVAMITFQCALYALALPCSCFWANSYWTSVQVYNSDTGLLETRIAKQFVQYNLAYEVPDAALCSSGAISDFTLYARVDTYAVNIVGGSYWYLPDYSGSTVITGNYDPTYTYSGFQSHCRN